MTRRLAWVLAAALFACTSPLAAARNCGTATTQADLDACAGDAFARADAALNLAYKTVTARLKSQDDAKTALVAAQKAWIGFRDDECAFEASGSAGGSVHPMIVTQCRTKLTQARTAALRQMLSCGEGDLGCPLPPN